MGDNQEDHTHAQIIIKVLDTFDIKNPSKKLINQLSRVAPDLKEEIERQEEQYNKSCGEQLSLC